MMELPNYSRQLMQQLRAMRKEGQFCDCTILVGDSPHRAHKVVLAASSLLFRSLLEGSDSISIDTAVVSCQEFTCLLDMVYTGKLPPGKHNFTRIIAAADSLQMFDVAVGCKNILTNLMKQTTTTTSTQPALPSLISTSTQPLVKRLQSQGAEQTASPKKAAPSLGKGVVKTTPSGGQVKSEVAEAAQVNELGESGDEPGVDVDPQGEPTRRKGESSDGPACKRARLQLPEVIEQKTGSSVPVEESTSPGVCVDDRNGSSVLLEHCSELTELLSEVPSITELLIQAAHSSLGEEEREVVCGCCEGGDPGSATEKLMDRVREGAVSEGGLRTLLHSVQENAPSLCPRLLRLLEEAQEREEDAQDTGGSEAEEQEEQPRSPANADDNTNEEEEGQEDREEEKEEDEGRGKRKPKPKGAASSQPYACRWCTKTFSYKCRMVAHTKRCTLSQEARHRCPLCPQEVPTLRALQLHHAQAHPDSNRTKKRPQVTCDMCGRTFAHPSGMLYHKRTEHFEEKPFACEECGAKFGANSSLKNHMRLHTGEKPFHCKHCDMSFSVAAALAYHTKKKHSEGKMYACQYCEALFAQSIELTRHVRTHTGDKPYVCRECGKGFSQANGLSVHLQTFHNISEPHDCQKCRLSFSSLDDHRQHIQECHPKDFHQCPECKKVFSSPALLDKHKASHSGSKPFSCKLCHKSYQQLSGLWYHNRTTHPEVFAGQSHRQLKTLLQCSACSRFFPSANSLAKHQKAEHPGLVDPYTDELVTGHADMSSAVKCLYCPSLFPSEAEMQEHASSEHFSQEGAAFGCSLCPLVCPSQLQLQEHFLSCHIGALEEQEQASTSQMVIQTEEHDGEAEHVMSLDQSQLGGSQQVFVALGNSEDGQSSSEVVAVNVEDLLNGTVTFICGDSQ